jgi:hypothetical protein
VWVGPSDAEPARRSSHPKASVACHPPMSQSFEMLRRYSTLRTVVFIPCLGLLTIVLAGLVNAADLAQLKPGQPVDYAPLAFQPQTWKAKGPDLQAGANCHANCPRKTAPEGLQDF